MYILIKIDIYFIEVTMEKKQVSFRVEPAIIKKLKFLAVELDRSLTDLFMEAIHDLLEKYKERVKR
jgi:predicted transcriptional regulator